MEIALRPIDWAIIGLYVLFAVALGAWFRRRASAGVDSFFVADRKFPWWLAGTSIVATTFAADTPLAVTGIVASGGIAGNWIWWCWGIAHLTATFFFARLWRRSRVITDAEICELRYGGRAAATLRGFKAVYNGVFINCLTMAWVIAAMVKISRAFFDVPPGLVIAGGIVTSVIYTSLGGIRGVVITDLVQFTLGMVGAIVLAVLAVGHFGGIQGGAAGPGLLPELDRTLTAAGGSLDDVIAFVPGADHPTTPLIYFVALLLFGWWRWAEGNGYIVQRLATTRDESHAQRAQLWFTVVHNAFRPWPWILVGLAALVLYPALATAPPASLGATGPGGAPITVSPGSLDVATGGTLTIDGAGPGWRARLLGRERPLETAADGRLTATFGRLGESAVTNLELVPPDGAPAVVVPGLVVQLADREMAYPLLMGRFLPPGLLGLVVASLLAAFMSTIDTHVNWGASYLVQDVYRRFLRPGAGPRECVAVSRLCIVLMAILAGGAALLVQNIAEVWLFLLTLGAGLGSVSAARWYWWRVTAWAELAAIAVSTLVAVVLLVFFTPTLFGGANPWFAFEMPRWVQIPAIALISLVTWVAVSIWGPPNETEALERFARRVRPPGPGWRGFRRGGDPARAAMGPMAWKFVAGLGLVFGALFGLGYLILGPWPAGLALLVASAALWAWVWRPREA